MPVLSSDLILIERAGVRYKASASEMREIIAHTRATLVAAAVASQLIAQQVYLITDENRLAVGLSATTYQDFAKASEAGVADNAVTNLKLADMAANTVKVRAAATSGDPSDLALSASNLIGRGSTGDIAPITIGNNLEFVGASLETKAKRIIKTANTNRASTTALAADADLVTPSLVAGTYRVRAVIFIYNANSTANFKWGMLDAAGANANFNVFRGMYRYQGGNTTTENVSIGNTGVGNVASVFMTSAIGLGRLEWDFVVTLNATKTIGLWWAQNTSDANNTTIERGSYIEYERVI